MSEAQFKNWKKKNSGCRYWLNIPLSWYAYFQPEDFDWITSIYSSWRKAMLAVADSPSDTLWQKKWIGDAHRRTFKKILRSRRNSAFSDGMYVVRSTYVYLEPVFGKYNSISPWSCGPRSSRPKKGDVLMWIECDELGRQIFLFKNHMWSSRGAYLDGISKI